MNILTDLLLLALGALALAFFAFMGYGVLVSFTG
jgi:hypothetical protein